MGLPTVDESFSDESFSRKIRWLEDRVAELQQGVHLNHANVMEESLEELKNSLEELHILNEEMERQNRELRASQSALAEERQRYQELFDQVPNGYLITDLCGVVQQANWTAGNQLGLPPDQLRGKPLLVFITTQHQKAFDFHFNRLVQSNRTSEFETTFQPSVGEAFPARVTVNPARDSRGQVTGLRWLVHDITEQNRTAEERSRQAEELAIYQEAFRQLSDGIPEFAIFLLDPSGHVATWNRGAQEIKGYEASEIIGQHFSRFYPEEDVQRGKPEFLLQLSAVQGSSEDEGWRVRQNGERFWASVLIAALRGTDGQLWGFAKVVRELTERKHTEEALAFHAHLMRNLAEGVVVVRDRDGTIAYTNSRFEEMLGYGAAELIGQPVSIVNAPDDRSAEEITREIVATARQEGVWEGELQNVRKDGTTLWCHASVSSLEHPELGPLWVAVHTDITQRKEAEEALRESETRFRSLVESANAAIVVSDEDGRIISWNRGAQSIFGYSQEDVLGQPSTLLMPEQHRENYQRALTRAVGSSKDNLLGKTLEFQARRKDGSEFPAELSLFSWRTGSRRYFSAIVRDLTERQRAEEYRTRLRELAREEEERRRLQTLIDTSPVGVMVVDARTQRLVLVNREAQRLRGNSYQPGKTLDECGQDIKYRRPDGQEWEMTDLPVRRALKYGETVHAEEIINEFADGHSFPTLVNASPVYSPDGKIVSAICIIQDMTPLQEMETLRNDFLGMVTHELRTPLSTIKGAAAAGLRARLSSRSNEGPELFQIIEDQVDQVSDLVSDLLDLTRIQAGIFSISAEPTDMASILEETLTRFGRVRPDCRIDLHLPPDLPEVQVDRRRIIQVLTNLLDNAARFSPPDVPVTVDLEHQDNFVTVQVKDRGPGIPPEKLPYLFKKFSRLDEGSASKGPGTGLGLAICQGIVEAHGEHIWASSGPDVAGTTITFTLPVAAAPVQASPEEAYPGARSWEEFGTPGERFKVLAVDDDQNALRFLRRLLEGAGYQSILASNPQEALEAVDQKAPDLVLLDLLLGSDYGVDVMQHIREYSDVPVIFLTARTARDDMVNALRLGGDDYVTKPFSESELLARIEAVLRRKALGGTIQKTPPYEYDGLVIDFDQRRVTVAGKEVSLSGTEYRLLSELAKHSGRVMTHDQILQQVWGRDYSGETELVRTTVRRLRHKLGDNAQDSRYVITVAQVGYRMAVPSTLESVSA